MTTDSFPWFWMILSGFISGLTAWLWLRDNYLHQLESLKIKAAEIRVDRDGLNEQLQKMEPDLRQSLQEAQQLRILLARMQQARKSDGEKLQWIQTARTELKESFSALANHALLSNTEAILQRADETQNRLMSQIRDDWNHHKTELSHIVDPVHKSLQVLDTQVRDLERNRQGAYEGLHAQIARLIHAHTELQTTTISLAQAMKSPTVRGRWGEITLRRVVELAGMTRHVTFEEQVNTGEGRPDMIIYLPNGGILPVDAKVPLDAFLAAAESADDSKRSALLANHARQVMNRVRELGNRKYWSQFDTSPECVVMFIPNEAFLGAAFDADPRLLEQAIQQGVLITSPVTLVALLKAVAFGWQQHQMTENTRIIASQAKDLFDRLVTFTGHLTELGKYLNQAVVGYNKSIGSFEKRLLPSARKFYEMGVSDAKPAAPGAISQRAEEPARGDAETPDDIAG